MGAPIRLGIIGCGNVSLSDHIPAALEAGGIELVALADPTPDRLAAALERAGLGADAGFADWRAIVDRSDVEAIVVTTPQRVRPEIAIAAAAAGKHLLCEKPLALSPAEAHRMVEAARRTGVVLATVHNYTFIPVYRAIKDVVAGGEIGELETATLNFLGVEDRAGTATYRPRWRHDAREAGGGVLMDMLHAVYLGWWFFDQRPTSVSAFVDRRLDREGDVEDYALVRYRLPRGQVMINMAWGQGPGGVELMGTQGRLVLVNEGFGTHPFVPPERIHVVGRRGTRTIEPDRSWGPGHRLTMTNFRDAVLGQTDPAATGEEGAAVLEAVVGAYKSGATGGDVALPLSPDDPVYRRGAAGIADLALPPTSPVRQRGLYGVVARGAA